MGTFLIGTGCYIYSDLQAKNMPLDLGMCIILGVLALFAILAILYYFQSEDKKSN
jgi:membrane protein DedA with SNARE-associated domain